MSTIYDFTTMALFAGLVVLFLHRSTQPEPRDNVLLYLPPAIGCAIANYLGNQGQAVFAIVLIAGVAVYVLVVLKPFNPPS